MRVPSLIRGIGVFGAFALICLLPAQAAVAGITLATIEEIIRSNHVTKVDELIPLLPPALRKNFSLVTQTRNRAQFASFESPRIILFSDDGSFQMTFTGNPDVPGGNLVEILSQDGEGKFNPSTITFLGGEHKINRAPGSCKGCHGMVIRPIWDGYPNWAGTYGSNHDILREGHLRVEGRALTEREKEFIRESREYSSLRSFLAGPAKEGRFAHLLGLNSADYHDLANLNSHFSDTLELATNRQLAGLFLNDPKVDNKGIRELLEILQSSPPGAGDDEALKEISAEFKERYAKIEPRLTIPLREQRFALDHEYYSAIEKLAKRLGIDPEYWKLGAFQSTYRQIGGRLLPHYYLHDALLKELVDRDPRFRPYVTFLEHKYGESLSQKGKVPRISAEGLALLDQPSYRIPRSPLRLEIIENMFPIVDVKGRIVRACLVYYEKIARRRK